MIHRQHKFGTAKLLTNHIRRLCQWPFLNLLISFGKSKRMRFEHRIPPLPFLIFSGSVPWKIVSKMSNSDTVCGKKRRRKCPLRGQDVIQRKHSKRSFSVRTMRFGASLAEWHIWRNAWVTKTQLAPLRLCDFPFTFWKSNCKECAFYRWEMVDGHILFVKAATSAQAETQEHFASLSFLATDLCCSFVHFLKV